MGIELNWGASTDTGLRRRVNEDALIAEFPLFLVADGMGGHEAGELASERALAAFRPLVGRPTVSIEDLAGAFGAAVTAVAGIGTQSAAAGTTLTGVAVAEHAGAGYWLVLNLGDSRTYRMAAGELEQISVDHSAVQELIDAGRLAAEDAEQHPERHVITKAIGAGSRSEPDYWLLPAHAGDRLLVCSDGLSRELDAEQIARVLTEEVAPQAAATRLVHEALLRGGHDNVTVIVIDAQALPDDDHPTARVGDPEQDVDEAETVPRVKLEGAGDGQV